MSAWLLLPGMDGSGELYAPLVRRIASDPKHRVDKIAVVRYSPRVPMSYPELTQFAAAQMPAGKMTLIAESFSGPIAIGLAAQFPDRIERVVLSCTFVSNPWPWLAPLAPALAWMPLLPAPFTSFFGAEMLFNEYNSATNRTELQRALAELSPSVLRSRMQAVLGCDVRDTLVRCPQAMVYLQARQDRVIPHGAAATLLAARPDIRLVQLDGPHCLLQTRADQAWAAIVQPSLHRRSGC